MKVFIFQIILSLAFLFTAISCKEKPIESKKTPALKNTIPTTKTSTQAASKNKMTIKAKAIPAAKGLDDKGAMQISERDRCPVCAMSVHKHKKFASAIALKNKQAYYFCGTGCMMKAWLHPEIFISAKKEDLAKAVTPEYFAGEYIDAMTAHWVYGSDVVGPMGKALVPLKDEKDLKTFQTRHGGKGVFKLSELSDEKWQTITGKKATMRPKGMMGK